MSKLFDSLNGGSVAQQKKKKAAVRAICVTVILVAVALSVLIISLIVSAVKKNNIPEDTGDNDSSGKTTTTTVSMEATDVHKGSLILVNKEHIYDFNVNPESELVKMEDYVAKDSSGNAVYNLRNSSLLADKTAVDALNSMLKAYMSAPADSGSSSGSDRIVTVTTAYRSKDTQDAIGSSTKGGYSDFHTGMLFELKNSDGSTSINETTHKWIYENAHKYGFIVRYPSDRSVETGVSDFTYAFRYVGVAHATYIYENGLCLEEYINLLHSKTSDAPLSVKGADGVSYEIYYVAASSDGKTDVTVPTRYNYTVSGDNLSGFIVTVNKAKSSAS